MLKPIFRLGTRRIKAPGSQAVCLGSAFATLLRPSLTLKAAASIAWRIASMRPLGTLGALSCYTLLVTFFLGMADLKYARKVFPAVQPTSAGTVGLINRI